ncbi:hypothetical protein BC939DRAFT_459869 [Gamsiella multidivaricata]|uniref:uncharacterized protein n=1 Tax=Gamsiella multidivaricata TaxID=101098 RepID=UPI00221FF995|nr:uncharacterized protein BC939DRAFT_459869 [Gamsiella multidivaricata]KAI7819472.1 hypothetical protein BC939DRAFT_459869 [Gamsiella multidivaricata]
MHTDKQAYSQHTVAGLLYYVYYNVCAVCGWGSRGGGRCNAVRCGAENEIKEQGKRFLEGKKESKKRMQQGVKQTSSFWLVCPCFVAAACVPRGTASLSFLTFYFFIDFYFFFNL